MLLYSIVFVLPLFEVYQNYSPRATDWRNTWTVLCCCCCWVASIVSDSVRPHRRQPTRLPRPWDSPGKNTGVGCHFLFQFMKAKSESEAAQSCLTHSNPRDCSLLGSSVHGTFQARVMEWIVISTGLQNAGSL